MIDSGNARANRLMAKDARMTATGTVGSRTRWPELIDTNLIHLPRDESAVCPDESRQVDQPKPLEIFLSNTIGTLVRRQNVR